MSEVGLISIFVTVSLLIAPALAAPRTSPLPFCSRIINSEDIVERVPNSFHSLELNPSASPELIASQFNKMVNEGYLTREQLAVHLKTFEPQLQKQALEVLAVLSQWATPSSFATLEEAIVGSLPENSARSIVWQASSASSLSAVTSYLLSKSDRPQKPANSLEMDGISLAVGSSRAILEPSLIQRMLTDSEYAARLDRKNTHFIYAEGFTEGINFVSYMWDAENLVSKVFRTLKLLEAKPNLSVADALYELSTRDLLQRFPFLSNRIHRVSHLKKSPESYTLDDVAQLHRPRQVRPSDISEALSRFSNQFPGADTKEVLKLVQSAFLVSQIVSYPRLMKGVRNLLDRTVSLAAEQGVKKENIRVVVPNIQKSYAMTAYMARSLGIITEEQIVTNAYQGILGPDPIATVTLDDFAGTGASLAAGNRLNKVTSGHPARDLRISAVAFITERAREAIERYLGEYPTGRSFLLWDSVAGTDLRDRMISINSKAQAGWTALLGKSYQETGTHIVFPYMSPDNNFSLFGSFVGPLFLPKAAAKSGTYVPTYAQPALTVSEMRADHEELLPTIRKILAVLTSEFGHLQEPAANAPLPFSFKVDNTVYNVHRRLWETSLYNYVSTREKKEFWVPKDSRTQVLISLEEQLRSALENVANIAGALSARGSYYGHVITGPKLFPSKTLAVILDGGQTTEEQLTALRNLWNAARVLAQRTGISLDLDSRNLIWDKKLKAWQLIRVLPRLMRSPYCFTLDSNSFSEFVSYSRSPENCLKIKNPVTPQIVMDRIEFERSYQ